MGYSRAVRAGNVIAVTGTVGIKPDGSYPPTIEEQTRQCLRNVEAILQAAGSTIDDVVQATFILLDESDFAGMNEEWTAWFPEDPPARYAAKLGAVIPGVLISIRMTAFRA